jgi:hypothetical protein
MNQIFDLKFLNQQKFYLENELSKNQKDNFSLDRQRDVITRLWREAERHMHKLEENLSQATLADAARNARALSSLARALRELILVESSMSAAPDGLAREDDAHDDAQPRSLEELRSAVAQHLVGLRGSGRA